MASGVVLLGAALVLAAVMQGLPLTVSAARLDRSEQVGDDSFSLPAGFLFGAGSSAIQTEGAWDEDGKSPSVMDKLLQLAANLPDDSPYKNMTNGMQHPDTAADSYHRWREDVAAARELKLQVYRFSVSWPRVLPDGQASRPNAKGVDFYHKLIDALLEAGIQPMITMHHFDLPYPVDQATGGWSDPRIVDAFVEYADFLFSTYGSKVKLWTTVNEPNYYCMNFALISLPGSAARRPGDDYKCVHHTNLAHMRVYRLYQDRYRKDQQGQIGAAALAFWCRPNSTSYEDIQAAERGNLFALGSVYHPLVHGDYPAAMRERVDRYSALEGLAESRLPRFTDAERLLLKGSADFLCFNAYMGSTVVDATRAPRPRYGTLTSDRDVAEVRGHTMTPGHFGGLFMEANPWVLREAPLWIRDNYNNTPIMITENGWGDETDDDPLTDDPRVGYHSEYLGELVRVAEEEQVAVMGYIAWSLLDSFEWSANYGRKFGLVHVDYEGGSLNRTLKKSAWFFKQIGETRRVARVAFQLKESSAAAPRLVPSVASAIAAALAVLATRAL